MIYGKTDKVSFRYDIVRRFLETIPLTVKETEIPVQRTLLFHLLLGRSKATMGFPRERFYLEFSRVFFVCAVLEAKGMDLSRNQNFFEYGTSKDISALTWNVLLDILEENPL